VAVWSGLRKSTIGAGYRSFSGFFLWCCGLRKQVLMRIKDLLKCVGFLSKPSLILQISTVN